MAGHYLRCDQCRAGDSTDNRADAEQFLVDHHRHRGVWVVLGADLSFAIDLVEPEQAPT